MDMGGVDVDELVKAAQVIWMEIYAPPRNCSVKQRFRGVMATSSIRKERQHRHQQPCHMHALAHLA
eukprot:5084317-Pyramimonas_sp.AAC.1